MPIPLAVDLRKLKAVVTELPVRSPLAPPPRRPLHGLVGIAPREVVMRDARVNQPSWSRRYLAPSDVAGDTEHAYALELLAEIFGGGATVRINRSVVAEQALAASAT